MIDAYVFTTPNGFKALIALEELGLPYRVRWIDINKGEQNTPEFLAINPNNKIPAVVDDEGPSGTTVTVFESGALLVYLAEKTGKLLPAAEPARSVVLSWVFFNTGAGAMFGQYGHFAKFAEEKIPEAIERFEKETHRLLKVLDRRLGEVKYLGGELSIADVMNVPWVRALRDVVEMDLAPYANVVRWLEGLEQRPAFAKALAMKPG